MKLFSLVSSLAFLVISITAASADGTALKPGVSVDGSKIVFDLKAWQKANLEPRFIPWEGRNITFLTLDEKLDPAVCFLL